MWCQLVSEADHSLPFHREGKKQRKRKRKREEEIERLRGGKGKQDNTLWFCCGKKDRRKKKSGEDEGQAVNHSCRFSISALNVSPCQNVMMWTELISPLTNNKKAIPPLQRCKAELPSPSSPLISHNLSKGLFLGWEMGRERTAGEKMTARQVHLPPTTTNWSLSAIKSNNNNKIELSNVPPNAQPQQWLQQ